MNIDRLTIGEAKYISSNFEEWANKFPPLPNITAKAYRSACPFCKREVWLRVPLTLPHDVEDHYKTMYEAILKTWLEMVQDLEVMGQSEVVYGYCRNKLVILIERLEAEIREIEEGEDEGEEDE